MIEEVKQVLGQLDFNVAAIVDDAYDEAPSPEDFGAAPWDRFFDDISEEEELRLRELFGTVQYDAAKTPADLARDASFVNIVWSHRYEFGAKATALFAGFEYGRSQKLDRLQSLDQLLAQDLNLPTKKMGRAYDGELEKAQIIFLDLFLGPSDDAGAVDKSIERIKQVVDKRRINPPVVFLMSESPRLADLAKEVRDKAELLGCQFRTVRKSDLADKEATLELIYDLVVGYPDSQRINKFILAWDSALTNSKTRFLQEIRTMDLADYANMHGLILEAEEQELGDYVVDLYDLYLHNIIEGHEPLIRAAKQLNGIDWKNYPAAQFMPSDIVLHMMDGSLFHNERRTEIEAEIDADPSDIRFGDVFLAKPEIPEAAQPPDDVSEFVPGDIHQTSQAAAGETQRAFVLITQPCDLARNGVEVALLLRGKAVPYEWKQHEGKRSLEKTPIMISNGKKFAINWAPLTPHTWEMASVSNILPDGVQRSRRLRLGFALQLQRAFLDGTGRIGTQVDLPGHFDAGVSVYFRTAGGKAKRVIQVSADSGDAVCLVGRTKKQALEWLILSDRVVTQIREAMAAAPEEELPKHEKKKFLDAVKSPAFKRKLKGKLEISRGRETKPFQNTDFDTILVSTTQKLSDGQEIDPNGPAILIEVEGR